MTKVLIYTDAITLLSGLARCAREQIARFHQHPFYHVFQAGWHSMGMPHPYPIQIFPVYRNAEQGGDEPERIYQMLRQLRPRFVIAIGDTFYFPHVKGVRERIAKEDPLLAANHKWLGWITVDGDPVMGKQLKNLLSFDAIAPMSRFAENEIRKAGLKALNPPAGSNVEFDAAELDQVNRVILPMRTLYPGVDAQMFHPRGVSWEFNGRSINRDSTFVALVVDQNTSRKAVPNAIEAFAKFSEGKSDVFLYLATDPQDPHGTDLEEITRHLGITDRVYIRRNSPLAGMSDDELAQLYNIATVLMSCTSGEGFKLPILEAMMSRCLNVMPDYTSPTELLEGGRGILVPAEGSWTGTNNFHKKVVFVPRMTEALEKAYKLWKEDRADLNRSLDAAQRYAMGFTWDKTWQQTESILQGLYTGIKMELEVA